MSATEAEIRAALQALQQDGAFCVIAERHGDRYVQFTSGGAAAPGAPTELYAEVASGRYADGPDSFALDAADEARLAAFGYASPDAEGGADGTLNYWQYLSVAGDAALAQLARDTAEILHHVLGVDPADADIELELGG